MPPVTESESTSTLPRHTPLPPLIATGIPVTVTIDVSVPQPVVYNIVASPPLTPVTTPLASTVAVAVLALLQIPPVVAQLNDVVLPAQMDVVPVTGAGWAFTVIHNPGVVAVPQPLVTV